MCVYRLYENICNVCKSIYRVVVVNDIFFFLVIIVLIRVGRGYGEGGGGFY